MSYILDALRKADAERERGTVPGLHAQAQRASTGGFDGPARSGPQPAWLVAGVLLLALCGLGGAWWLWPATAPPAPPAAAPAAAAVTPVPPPAVVAAPPAAPPPPLPAASPLPAALPAPATVAAPPPLRPAPDKRSRPESPPVAAALPTPGALPAATPASAAARKPDTRLPTARELPEDIRRELPALSVNGASYSETPANRLLIVNGQLFHEGESVGPDHVLEQIRLKSAVLRFRGVRYVLEY